MSQSSPTVQPPSSVDLSSCDREPIHILGAVQPFGFLLAVSPDWIVARASANAPEWLGRPVEAMLGLSLNDLLDSEAIHVLRGHLQTLRGPDAVDRVFGVRLLPYRPLFDVALHLSAGSIVIEAEPSAPEYSCAPPGQSQARARLARPFENRLFFAGEATHPFDFTTAHGAHDSGVRAADEAMAAFSDRRRGPLAAAMARTAR